MLIDKNLLCSDAQDLGQTNATYLSTNSIDLGNPGTLPLAGLAAAGNTAGFDPGKNAGIAELQVWAQVVVAFTTSASGVLTVKFVTADDAALTSNLTVIYASPALAVATLVAGYQMRFGSVPPGITQRYCGFQYIIGTGAMTAGKVSAGLVTGKQTNYAGL